MAGPEAPTLDEWRRLYTLADQIKAMAPWQWMEEVDIFGVQNPETSELGFVSVMGMLGEHLAITVYRGGRAIEDFWRIQLDDTYFPPERIIELPQVQLSFEDRSELESDDHSVLKLLRLSYRGKQSWPMFRSYQPGYAPWYLDSAEARLLTWTLQQVLEVAPRFKEHEKELSPAVREQDLYLVRLPQRKGEGFVWHDEFLPAPKEEVIVDTLMDMAALDALKRRPAGKWKLEMDLVMLPAPIQENRSVRPRFPYFLMIVDSDSGYVFHSDIMTVDEETSLVDLWGRVPAEVVRALGKEEILRPTTVVVRTGLMREILERLSTELGFKLKRADELPALDEAKESFLDVLTRRRRP
jgi:hypothetical protein